MERVRLHGLPEGCGAPDVCESNDTGLCPRDALLHEPTQAVVAQLWVYPDRESEAGCSTKPPGPAMWRCAQLAMGRTRKPAQNSAHPGQLLSLALEHVAELILGQPLGVASLYAASCAVPARPTRVVLSSASDPQGPPYRQPQLPHPESALRLPRTGHGLVSPCRPAPPQMASTAVACRQGPGRGCRDTWTPHRSGCCSKHMSSRTRSARVGANLATRLAQAASLSDGVSRGLFWAACPGRVGRFRHAPG